jgi:hypothetical protein
MLYFYSYILNVYFFDENCFFLKTKTVKIVFNIKFHTKFNDSFFLKKKNTALYILYIF